MAFDQDHDNADGYQGTIGLVITLAVVLSLGGVVLIIVITHFCAKHLLRSQQRTRRHNNDLLYLIQIAHSNINFSESPNSGLDPEIIASLPKILYKETDQFKQGEEVVECSVCLGTIVEDAAVRVLPNCKHVFHVDCVDTWLSSKSTCPVCRTVAEPRVQNDDVQPSAPLDEEDGDGGVSWDVNHELEEVEMGCSGLRTASFPRMVISSKERSLRRNTSYDGSAAVVEDTEKQ